MRFWIFILLFVSFFFYFIIWSLVDIFEKCAWVKTAAFSDKKSNTLQTTTVRYKQKKVF